MAIVNQKRCQTQGSLYICECFDQCDYDNDMSVTSPKALKEYGKAFVSFAFGTEEFNAAYAPLNTQIEKKESQFSAMVLKPKNKFWLFYMPKSVLDMVNKTLVDAMAPLQKGHILANLHAYLNAVAFYLPTIDEEGSVSFGKRFICTIFEGMYKLGFDFITSTDTCENDKQSTIIFEKNEGTDRLDMKCSIMYIASSETNKLLLGRCPDSIVNLVKEAITSTWPKGITKINKSESGYMSNRQPLWKFLLGGEPWNSKGEQSTAARRLWIKVRKLK